MQLGQRGTFGHDVVQNGYRSPVARCRSSQFPLAFKWNRRNVHYDGWRLVDCRQQEALENSARHRVKMLPTPD
jgi:hypothetical protein